MTSVSQQPGPTSPPLGLDRPRLVASDLDGTLLRRDGTVSEVTARVWQQVQQAGIETVVVTARPPRWLDHLGDLMGEHGLAICCNGAFVYDVAGREILQAHGFTQPDARNLIGRILEAYPNAGAAVETNMGMFRTPGYPDPHRHLREHDGRGGVTDCDLDELPVQAVIGKILILDPSWRDDAFVTDLARVIGADGVLAYSGAAGLAEISAPGVSKAARLAGWCAERGIEATDAWAFGDMPNDIPMLEWAGRGIVVANAHADARAVADDECASNDADGVARYLLERVVGLA